MNETIKMADGNLLITDQTVRYARQSSQTINHTVQENTQTAFQTFTNSSKAMAELNGKIFEFAQINFNAAVDFSKQLANAGTMKDVVRMQTAYMQGQTLAFGSQIETLRDLSMNVFRAAFEPFKAQSLLAMQQFRSC